MKRVSKLFSHICIILSLVMLTFLVIDLFFNPAMGFINNMAAKYIMLVLCVITLVNSIINIITFYKRRKK